MHFGSLFSFRIYFYHRTSRQKSDDYIGTIDIYFATGPANVIYILCMEDGENVEQLEWWHGSFKKKNMFVAKVTEQTIVALL